MTAADATELAPGGLEVTVYPGNAWTNGRSQRVRTLTELAELATRTNWSPGLFENGERKTKNFLGEDVLGLDVDGGITLERAQEVLREHGLAGALLPTKNHQQEKDRKPACDRFRVILPLSEPITNPGDHSATWNKAAKLFDAAADQAAKDPARYFFRSKTVHVVVDGKPFSVVRAPALEPPQPRPVYRGEAASQGRWARFVETQWSRMYAELARGSGRHEAVHRLVQTLAGLHDGAGQGYPSKEDACMRAVETLVHVGRERRTAEEEVARSWKAGVERPFWPDERPMAEATAGDPRPEPPPIDHDEHSSGSVEAKSEAKPEEPSADKVPGWLREALRKDTYTFQAEDLDVEPASVRCLWGHYIVAGEVNVLTGPGGCGKSSLLTGLALAGATGQAFLGRTTREFQTVIFTTEDAVDDYKRKLHAWKYAYPGTWREATGRIHIIPLKGVPLALVESDYGQVHVAPGVVEALAERTRELVPDGEVLILVETVSRVSGGDETNAGAGMLVVALERLSLLTGGGTPVPVAHVGKENARQRQTDMYAARGGSALADNARSVLVLSRPPKELLEEHGLDETGEPDYLFVLAHAKHNRTPREPDLLLRRESGKHAAYFELWRQHRQPVGLTEETEEDSRARVGEALRQVVRHAIEADGVAAVTSNRLKSDYRERIRKQTGLAKNQIDLAVDQAVRDGWLLRSEPGQGGGKGVLRPGPGPSEKSPGGSRPEVARSRPGEFPGGPDSPSEEVAHALNQTGRVGDFSVATPPKSPGGRPKTSGESGDAGTGHATLRMDLAAPLPHGASTSTPPPDKPAGGGSCSCQVPDCKHPVTPRRPDLLAPGEPYVVAGYCYDHRGLRGAVGGLQ
jgi:RecA-family ATPase